MIAVLVGCAVTAWRWVDGDVAAPPPAAAVATAARTPLPLGALPAMLPFAAHPAAPATPPVPALPPPTARNTPQPPPDTGEVEVCGFGRVQLPSDDPNPLQRLPIGLRNAVLDEVEARLLSHADDQVRAAALLIAARASVQGARARIDQLARMAVGSRDPIVYAIALQGCKAWSDSDGSACQLLSRAQQVRLDPDNAQSWLELAAEANLRNDAEAEADAMRRAAQAQHSHAHDGLLPTLVDKALGPAVPALQRTLALSIGRDVQTVWSLGHSSQAYTYCVTAAAIDGPRQASCAALADTLARRSTSVEDRAAGLAIGRRLGWPAARLQALQQEQDAFSEAGGFQNPGIDLSCDSVERMQAWQRQLGTRGEVQALHDRLAHSGRSIEQWSARYRKNYALATAAAEAAETPTEP